MTSPSTHSQHQSQHQSEAAQSPPDQGLAGAPIEPGRRDGTRITWPLMGWVPYVLVGAFVAFWAVTNTNALIAGASSWRAILFGIGAGALTVGLLIGIARLTGRGWAGQMAGLVPLVVAVVFAVLPSYITTTVSESAPEGLPPAAAPADPSAPEASPPAPSAELPATPEAPVGPIELGAAPFVGIDHDAVGTARLIQLEDGSLLVRFEQFSVEPGPDYDVYIVPSANASGTAGGTLLGDLKGTVGDQNYEIPAGVIPAAGVESVTVLIWCTVFAVPIANATV